MNTFKFSSIAVYVTLMLLATIGVLGFLVGTDMFRNWFNAWEFVLMVSLSACALFYQSSLLVFVASRGKNLQLNTMIALALGFSAIVAIVPLLMLVIRDHSIVWGTATCIAMMTVTVAMFAAPGRARMTQPEEPQHEPRLLSITVRNKHTPVDIKA